MNKSLIIAIILILSGSLSFNAQAQLGGLMNKVKSKIVDKALGNDSGSAGSQNAAVGKEPACASDDAVMVFEFEKGVKIAMNEISISIRNGDILLFSKANSKYFIKKKNSDTPDGPYEADDPRVKWFNWNDPSVSGGDELIEVYPDYISRTGDKYSITFGGKTYGPYAGILSFAVNSSATKFAATISKDAVKEDNEMEKIGEMIENAKTDEEKMQIAMQNQQKIIEKSMGYANLDIMPRLITNVQGAKTEALLGSELSASVKLDDIVWISAGAITDLYGKTLMEWEPYKIIVENNKFWLSSDNKRYAVYNQGVLKISDNREFQEVISPYRIKEGGNELLVYLYFSPKNSAIMQVSIPF